MHPVGSYCANRSRCVWEDSTFVGHKTEHYTVALQETRSCSFYMQISKVKCFAPFVTLSEILLGISRSK